MMRPISSLGLRSDGARVELLDQRLLPDEERWVDATDPDDMAGYIHALAVRGAPLLGVAGAVCLGLMAARREEPEAIRRAAARLREARPTAVNLAAMVDRVVARWTPDAPDSLCRAAMEVFDEDVALGDAMAARGASLLSDGDGVLTHCNTGGLATAGVGTALGVVLRAWEAGVRLHVFVDETRPLLQGGRLTAWELARAGVPHTLITDSMAAVVMRAGRVQRVLVGADRIARNGDFANKIGTYGLAVAARHHRVPFHPVAPWTTVDLACASGDDIPIEERDPAEVRGVKGSFGATRWAPESSPAFNPAFDVTPADLVTSLVLDRGVFTAAEFAALARA
ncbi:MAG: S-methyl-5-thioribose-1-phosphate isomerase [Polyangiales bacterium]